MVITAFGEEHVGLYSGKKEKVPAGEAILVLKTLNSEG